jgi:hypothetical protein
MLTPVTATIGDAPITLLAALITGFFAWFVQAARYRRETDDKATQVLREYRNPLLRAAFELQSRLYNIAARGYLEAYWKKGADSELPEATLSTLWLFGQYLGWSEILRREVQYLDLGSQSTNQTVQRRINEISAALATDSPPFGRDFIAFRSDQRAIGEFMVTERDGGEKGKRLDCRGYSEFIETLAEVSHEDRARDQATHAKARSPVLGWVTRLASDFERIAEQAREGERPPRLVNIQRHLIDLVDLLDPDRARYPHLDFRGKLPLIGTKIETEPPDRMARFIWDWNDPWVEVEAWATRRHLKRVVNSGEKRTYRGRPGPLLRRPEFDLTYEKKRLTIEVRNARGTGHSPVDGSMRAARVRNTLNDLLRRFDRPLVAGGTTFPSHALRSLREKAWRLTQSGSR